MYPTKHKTGHQVNFPSPFYLCVEEGLGEGVEGETCLRVLMHMYSNLSELRCKKFREGIMELGVANIPKRNLLQTLLRPDSHIWGKGCYEKKIGLQVECEEGVWVFS